MNKHLFIVQVLQEYAWLAFEERVLEGEVKEAVQRIDKRAGELDDSDAACVEWLKGYLE